MKCPLCKGEKELLDNAGMSKAVVKFKDLMNRDMGDESFDVGISIIPALDAALEEGLGKAYDEVRENDDVMDILTSSLWREIVDRIK